MNNQKSGIYHTARYYLEKLSDEEKANWLKKKNMILGFDS
jgi:hypothetical protein